MDGIVFLNGEYVAATEARISIFDRAVLFGDAVYEVAGVLGGRLLDFDVHMDRLELSLKELGIPQSLHRNEILAAFRELVKVNRLSEGLVYMQVTRGVEGREFVPGNDLSPNIFMFTQEKPAQEAQLVKSGVALKSTADIRWARRDIKSVNLLGQVLAKRFAHDNGAYEALMVDPEGYITECGATSFFIVRGGTVITRPLSQNILAGVTRKAIIALCANQDYNLEQRKLTLEEVYSADEVFISGASTYVLAVVSVDGRSIGDGCPGQVVQLLRKIYLAYAREGAI